jgi:hypothetical protein
MFGCYRRDQAADADTYTAAITMVLAHYSAEVVKAVTDPYGGIPSRKTENGWSGLPDVADVKEACEAEAARLDRLAEYAKHRTPLRRLRAPPAGPGAFATILVKPDSPQYERLKALTADADHREWKVDDQGLWVAYSWLVESKGPMKRFKPFSDDQLRNIYGTSPARELLEQTAGEGEI